MDKFWEGKVIRADGSEVPAKDAVPEEKKIICFYFSAHWCPPCRQFTPMLKEFYNKTKEQGIEVVFVSSDKTEKDMNDYYKESHGDWLRIAHKSSLAKELNNHFEVDGIPTLAVCKRGGDVITADGVEQVAEIGAPILDKWINGFDWEKADKNLALMRESEFIKSDGTKVSGKDALGSNKMVCFYFSAHWCGPCRQFTPLLKEFYSEVKEAGMEVVFISADNSEEEMNSYYEESHGSWLRAEHESDVSQNLMKHFECNYFPYMVVIKADGTFVTKEGTGAVRKDFKAGKGQELFDSWMA